MTLTKNATVFAAINSVATLTFLFALNYLVTSKQFDAIAYAAIAYALVWVVSGAWLGITDKARGYRGNVDAQYNLIALLISLVAIWLAKFLLPAIMPVDYGNLALVSAAILIIGAIQYYVANKNPKGIKTKEAFK